MLYIYEAYKLHIRLRKRTFFRLENHSYLMLLLKLYGAYLVVLFSVTIQGLTIENVIKRYYT